MMLSPPNRSSPSTGRSVGSGMSRSPRSNLKSSPLRLSPMCRSLLKSNSAQKAGRTHRQKGLARKLKRCRLCDRKTTDIDPVDSDAFLAWGYPGNAKIEGGLEIVAGKVDAYCSTVQSLTYPSWTISQLAAQYKAQSDFAEAFELNRDSCIACLMDEGGDATVTKKMLHMKREQVVRESESSCIRGKTGLEYEKSAFEKEFKHRPDLLKRAVYHHVRVRKGNKWVMEQRTSVWNEKDGVYAVREEDKESIKRRKYLDDGSIRITDAQAQDLADEATLETFGSMVNNKALTAEELGLGLRTASSSEAPGSWTSARGTPTARTPSKAADNRSEDEEVDDEDDEEEAPLSRMLGISAPAPKGKTKAKAKGKVAPTAGVKMESSPAADKTSNEVNILMDEASRCNEKFSAAQTMDEVPLETMENLHSRLQSKSRLLCTCLVN